VVAFIVFSGVMPIGVRPISATPVLQGGWSFLFFFKKHPVRLKTRKSAVGGAVREWRASKQEDPHGGGEPGRSK
jgi:hypothetical protein